MFSDGINSVLVVCAHAGCLDNSWEREVANAELRFFLGYGSSKNWAEHVSVPLLLESMFKFGYTNKCDFSLGGPGKGSFSLLIDVHNPTVIESVP